MADHLGQAIVERPRCRVAVQVISANWRRQLARRSVLELHRCPQSSAVDPNDDNLSHVEIAVAAGPSHFMPAMRSGKHSLQIDH
jgi:hypothetical protein